jgi:hypothetical protein
MNAFAPVAGIIVRSADLREERASIEAFIASAPEAELFHLPAWSLAVEKGCGQRSHYLIADDRDGQIAGLLPLSEIRSPLFGSALVSTGFGVGGGIVARTTEAAEALRRERRWALATPARLSPPPEFAGARFRKAGRRSRG